ncbi:hypothetical protein ACJIZ3_014243 [Penstemon smallii]|uniref:PUM-HD domain-containing protein n=1 Tax=Penstemon smallii TaxID=265156 RepID=A0ABD3RIZ9_9LAMI
MAPTPLKRKRDGPKSNPKKPNFTSDSKKPKLNSSSVKDNLTKKPFKFPKKDFAPSVKKDETEVSKKVQRIRSKELAEARKKKRKKHYSLEQELALLWEKMRRRNIAKNDRSMLVSEALKKMKGKISEIASSHVSSRVLQTCVKHCSQEERNAVFVELRPNFIAMSTNTYAVHLVTKMLDNAPKEQLAEFISSLHGHVASLLRHMVGSLVVEHVYNLGNATQKQALLVELYSPELQLFKDMVTVKETRLVDIISKLKLQKSSVIRHMTSVLQPILEKGILDHSIVHRAILEYLTIADKTSAADIIQQLSGLDLVRMIHTNDGSRLGILCVKHGSAKERKKIIKGMKSHVQKIAQDKFGSMVLVCIFSVVDDTKLVSKIIIRELESNLKELLLQQSGQRLILQLLHPNSTRYLTPNDITSLGLSIPSLSNKGELNDGEAAEEEKKDEGDGVDTSIQLNEGGKKDSFKRRQELLVNSGLAEKLIDACCEMAGDLLRSKSGKDVIYEVVTGGADGILHPTLDEKLSLLYEAIASLASEPKVDEQKEEHLLEQFHSSRTLRKLVLDSPEFASTLWEIALKGKIADWVKGHSSKVVKAFLETSNSTVKELAKKELQPFVKNGDLSVE